MRGIRKILKFVFITLSSWILSIFYSKKYLAGQLFENNTHGWRLAFKCLWWQRIHSFNRQIPWPVSPFNTVSNPDNIEFHPDDIINFQGSGKYFQNFDGKIVIGKGTYIANNVGIITSNHDPINPDHHLPGKDVIIGEKCWIGMNVVILPGVILGPHTTVGAGSIVTKSFSDGQCIIAGNPAKLLKVTHPKS